MYFGDSRNLKSGCSVSLRTARISIQGTAGGLMARHHGSDGQLSFHVGVAAWKQVPTARCLKLFETLLAV